MVGQDRQFLNNGPNENRIPLQQKYVFFHLSKRLFLLGYPVADSEDSVVEVISRGWIEASFSE